MGSTMAPNYANCTEFYFQWSTKFLLLPNIVLWRRYIDDIFMLWSGTENQLLQFYSFLNTSDEHLIMMIHVLVFWTFALLGMVRK